MDLTTVAQVKVKAAECSHPRRDVFIVIGSNADHNLIYAENEEHVSNSVTFFACDPCTLYFENTELFPQKKYDLDQGSNRLQTKGSSGRTRYSINQPFFESSSKIGPIIVVP